MKTKEQISEVIEVIATELRENKTKLNGLNQIDYLSFEGSQLRRKIAEARGKIKILKWVIESK